MKKNGRRPIADRVRPAVNPDDAFGNKLAIPAEIKKDLEARGLEAHWLDANKLAQNGGYHERDWEVYRKPEGMDGDKASWKFGNDPDGILRRGSVILGVKTKERAQKHKEYLQNRADRYKAAYDKDEAMKLREHIKNNELDSSIQLTSGFDDEDE